MPVHTVPRVELDATLRRIEREGHERLVSIVPGGEGDYEVRTEVLPAREETR